MSSSFQNRLVGTMIFVALGIIVLPDLLSGKKTVQDESFAPIPERTEFKDVVELPAFPKDHEKKFEPDEVEVVEEIVDEPVQQNAAPAPAKVTVAATPAPEKAKPSVKPKNTATEYPDSSVAWTIQLGTFRHSKNVASLLEKLRKSGYTAYSVAIKSNSGELTKVYVGPNLDKELLSKMLSPLKDVTGLSGKVIKYQPRKS